MDAAQEIMFVIKLLAEYNCITLHLDDDTMYQAICEAQMQLDEQLENEVS
jgi:hypothetical protein